MSTEVLLPVIRRPQQLGQALCRAVYDLFNDNIAIVAGPSTGLLVYCLTNRSDSASAGTQRLAPMFAILVWVCVWWLTEAVPVAITALLPLFLFPLLQVSTANDVAKAYMNDTISLFLGSFILALAVEKYNCHKRLALKTLLLFGGDKMDPRLLLLGFCAGPAFVSMFISNTATAIMMIPMAVGVVQKVQSNPPSSPPLMIRHHSSTSIPTSDDHHQYHPQKLDSTLKSSSCNNNPAAQKLDPADLETGPLIIPPPPLEDHESSTINLDSKSAAATEILSHYSKGVVIAVAYAVGLGGMSTLTGTGPNLVFSGTFRSLFPGAEPVTYMQWFMFAFPMAFVFLILLWILLCVFYCPTNAVPVVSASLNKSVIQKDFDSLGAMGFAEKVVISLFTTLAIMWMTRATNGVVPGWGDYFRGFADDGTVSVMMAIFLFIIPNKKEPRKRLMDWGDCKKLPWDIVLVLGGGFALAQGIRDSGLSEWIAAHLDFLHSLPYLLITPFVAVIVSGVTEFTSNNATATIFLPLLAEVSMSLNIHPLFLMVTATLCASLSFMLPIATPPNAIAYTAGNLRMTDLTIPGFVLKCIGIFLLSIMMPTLGVVVFGLDTRFVD